MAVAGVALGIGALLSVTGAPAASPVLEVRAADGSAGTGDPTLDDALGEALPPGDLPAEALPPGDLPAEDLLPEDLAPAVEPTAPAPTAPARPSAAAPAVPGPSPMPRVVAAAPPAARQPAARPAVAVLNNSTRTGLADRAAARFRRNGWPVSLTGNYRGRIRATTVYFEPGQQRAAQRFAATFRGIPRVLPRPASLPGPRGLVVVLTRDFPA